MSLEGGATDSKGAAAGALAIISLTTAWVQPAPSASRFLCAGDGSWGR